MEFLKDILGEDLYLQVETKINAHNEQNKEKQVKIANLGDGDYVSKSKYETLQNDLQNQKDLLKTANAEIDSYKSMDIDAIKKSAEDYKTKYETAENDYKARIAEMELNNKLEKYVDKLNLKNDIYKNAVISQIKEKELKFDGDTLLGGEELVKGFKEKYADAFNDIKSKPTFADTTPGTVKPEITKEMFNKMGYQARLKLYNENKTLYDQLKNNKKKEGNFLWEMK